MPLNMGMKVWQTISRENWKLEHYSYLHRVKSANNAQLWISLHVQIWLKIFMLLSLIVRDNFGEGESWLGLAS